MEFNIEIKLKNLEERKKLIDIELEKLNQQLIKTTDFSQIDTINNKIIEYINVQNNLNNQIKEGKKKIVKVEVQNNTNKTLNLTSDEIEVARNARKRKIIKQISLEEQLVVLKDKLDLFSIRYSKTPKDSIKNRIDEINASIEKIEEELKSQNGRKNKELKKTTSEEVKTFDFFRETEISNFTNEKSNSVIIRFDPNRSVKEENKVTLFENLKINFDGSKGEYEIIWKENGENKRKSHIIDKKYLNETNENTQNLLSKYGSGKDLNVIVFLKDFDLENKTDLLDKYMNHEIGVTYNLRKFSSINFLNKNEKKIFWKNIKNLEKIENKGKNIVIKNSIFDRKKIVSAAAMVGISVAVGLGVKSTTSKGDKKEEILEVNNMVIENSSLNDLNSDNYAVLVDKIADKFFLEENTFRAEMQKEIASESNIINQEKIVAESQLENNGLKIGSVVHLDNINLYKSSDATSSIGNTSNLSDNTFKISKIAIIDASGNIDVYNNLYESIEEFIGKYGESNKYMALINDVNGDAIGWIDAIEISNKLNGNYDVTKEFNVYTYTKK